MDLSKIRIAEDINGSASDNYAVDTKIISEICSFRKLNEEESTTLYERDEKGIVSSDFLNDLDLIKNNINLSVRTTFLRYLYQTFSDAIELNNQYLKLAMNLCDQFIMFERIGELKYIAYADDETTEYLETKLPKIAKYLNIMDIKVEKLFFKKTNDRNRNYLYVTKKRGDKYYDFPVSNESDGTIKVLSLLLSILDDRNEGLYIIDDFDSYLHPKLVKAFIDLFNSKENTNKQFVFNSHDIWNMNNKTFRRDEIWLTYKDDELESHFVPLSSMVNYKGDQIRKDAKYGKQYMEGRYGADPYIARGLSWEETK